MNRREFIAATAAAALVPVVAVAAQCTCGGMDGPGTKWCDVCVEKLRFYETPIVINQFRNASGRFDLRPAAHESTEAYFQRRYNELLAEALSA